MHSITRNLTLYTCIRFLIVVGILGVFFWYVLFQSRLLIAGPILELEEDIAVVQHDRVVPVTGTVQNVVTVTLNGRTIFVDESGTFREFLVLENGYSIMTIEAKDRYGRTRTIERPFMYSSS